MLSQVSLSVLDYTSPLIEAVLWGTAFITRSD